MRTMACASRSPWPLRAARRISCSSPSSPAHSSAERGPISSPPADWAQMGFDKVLPSVFALNGQEPIFGWEAKRASDGLQAVKRLLATEEAVGVGDNTVLVDEVVALMFAHMKR